MRINFTKIGWKDCVYWESQDKKTLKRINNLIEDIERIGNDVMEILQCRGHYGDK